MVRQIDGDQRQSGVPMKNHIHAVRQNDLFVCGFIGLRGCGRECETQCAEQDGGGAEESYHEERYHP